MDYYIYKCVFARKARKNSKVRLWTPQHGRFSIGRPKRTYLQRLCTDTGWSLEGLPEDMVLGTNSERVKEI